MRRGDRDSVGSARARRRVRQPTERGKMKKIVAAMLMLAAILMAGCSGEVATGGEQNEASKKDRANAQKPKTVVVNEGMSKEEEEELNERIDALEEEANEESEEQTTQTQE